MDLTKLKDKPVGPNISGNWTLIKIALKSWIQTMPQRNSARKSEIADDIVFKPGYDWVTFYSTQKKTKFDETGSENFDNDNVDSVFSALVGGGDQYRRDFLVEHGSEDVYVLIQKCGMEYPILLGDSCSWAKLTWNYSEEEDPNGSHGYNFKFSRSGAYVAPMYKGTVSGNNVFADDDTTPSVDDGSTFMTSANTGATEITTFDDAVVGSTIIVLGGGGGVNASTIADGGNFSLSSAGTWTADAGTMISFYVRGANDFVELDRA